MARGFLSGAVWGGVVSLGIAGVSSVLAPPPPAPELSAEAPAAAPPPERVEQAHSGETASVADRSPVTGQTAPKAPAPDVDTLSVDTETMEPSAAPVAAKPDRMDAPAEGQDVGSVAVTAESPVLPNPQALAPMTPQQADAVTVTTTPAAPPPSRPPGIAVVEGDFDAPAQPPADAESAQVATVLPAPAVTPPFSAQPAPTELETTPDEPVIADEAPASGPRIVALPPPPAVTGQLRDAPDADDEGSGIAATASGPQDSPSADAAPALDAPAAADMVPRPDSPAAPATTAEADGPVQTAPRTTTARPEGRPSIGTPATTLADRQDDVIVNRPAPGAAADPAPAGVESRAAAEGAPKPIVEYAAPFDPEGDKPLMSIVLIDDGNGVTTGADGIAALSGFPYPITFAVDTAAPGAAERMEIYRDAGFEVLAMVDLPQGATPADAETAFGVVLPELDQVVGVLEGTEGGFQGSRDVADQVTEILRQSGHGLITQDKGLNTMPTLARKQGVPAAPVFRDFDSKGQSATVIRRFMDGAAFKARVQGSVIMLGRLRPDTITALLQWALQDRASQVSLAPVSAVLQRE